MTNHPLVKVLMDKREHYLKQGRHAEAQGVSASIMLCWTYLQKEAKNAALQTGSTVKAER